ncbi:hypothetical protein GCM10022392_15100 [Mucilaginibacter panaciglaebae]|uniref:Uncharacterized protein n=1 Tax=Mucilaginibacter panaciglaebae TaxID=502331 RepID=A0ABP7WPA1_9SPHI
MFFQYERKEMFNHEVVFRGDLGNPEWKQNMTWYLTAYYQPMFADRTHKYSNEHSHIFKVILEISYLHESHCHNPTRRAGCFANSRKADTALWPG